MAEKRDSEFVRLQREVDQAFDVRREFYDELEKLFGLSVFALFTSFRHPSLLDDDDADMLEDALRTRAPRDGILLLIESPGGRALAAERIIRACREYANGPFHVAVPNQAKSAATMVCLGADRIWLGPTSELGPINPQQLFVGPSGQSSMVAVENIIRSYESLMAQAESSSGNVEPYLLQLARYDAREIEELKSANQLAEDIAVKALKSSMMQNYSHDTIKRKIKPLTQSSETKSHGRPIYYEEAKRIGLRVRLMKKGSRKWQSIRRLYTRLDWQVTHRVSKLIESKGLTYSQPVQKKSN